MYRRLIPFAQKQKKILTKKPTERIYLFLFRVLFPVIVYFLFLWFRIVDPRLTIV